MSRIDNALARLRVFQDSGLPLPADLQDEIVACLEELAGSRTRRQRRDALIRRAAILLPPTGDWQRAGDLLAEAQQLARVWHLMRNRAPETEPATPRACLHAAGLVAALPKSQRQFHRILCERRY